MNRISDADLESLRIPTDSRAEVGIGEFFRNGRSRDKENKKASDHDMSYIMKSVPFGILNMLNGAMSVFFGISAETGDFIADCVGSRREADRASYSHIGESVMNTDCGPDTSGNRTRFLRRMTESADKSGLRIMPAYYPPYHSRYNPIGRCRGSPERHRNGQIPDSPEKAVGRTGTMTCKGIGPVVRLRDKIYEKGIFLTEKEMKPYEGRLQISEKLPLWDIIIEPG